MKIIIVEMGKKIKKYLLISLENNSALYILRKKQINKKQEQKIKDFFHFSTF